MEYEKWTKYVSLENQTNTNKSLGYFVKTLSAEL